MQKLGRPPRNIFIALEVLCLKQQRWTNLSLAKRYGWATSKGKNDPEWKRSCSTVRRYAKDGRQFAGDFLGLYSVSLLLLVSLFRLNDRDFTALIKECERKISRIETRLKWGRRLLMRTPKPIGV